MEMAVGERSSLIEKVSPKPQRRWPLLWATAWQGVRGGRGGAPGVSSPTWCSQPHIPAIMDCWLMAAAMAAVAMAMATVAATTVVAMVAAAMSEEEAAME